MKKNIGNTDKVIRIILTLIIGTLYFTGIISGITAIILTALAVIFILTSLIGLCPIYLLFGLSTSKKVDK